MTAPAHSAVAVPSVARPAISAAPRLLQRKCACGNGASALTGECDECASKKLQRKLAVGSTDDPLEIEADRVADQVLAGAAPTVAGHSSPTIRRAAIGAPAASLATESVDATIADPGAPLAAPLRADMERRFGHDFGSVRIHVGASAARSAHGVKAKAYTVQNHVVFGAGYFAPETATGRRLLAHELTHVVQQSGGARSAGPVIRRAPLVSEPDFTTPEWIATLTTAQIRSRLVEIKLSLSSRLTSSGGDDVVELMNEEDLLKKELAKRHARQANAKKPRRKSKSATRAKPGIDAPKPLSASVSVNFDTLSSLEQAEELQAQEEWLALPTKVPRWQRRVVQEAHTDQSKQLEQRETAPLLERHRVVLQRIVDGKLVVKELKDLNRYERDAALEDQLRYVDDLYDTLDFHLDTLYERRREHPHIDRMARAYGGADDPDMDMYLWGLGKTGDAWVSKFQNDPERALDRANVAVLQALDTGKEIDAYFEDTATGAGRVVTTLGVLKRGGQVAAMVAWGPLGAAAYNGTQTFAEQTSEIDQGLRDGYDAVPILIDTASGYVGGKVGNWIMPAGFVGKNFLQTGFRWVASDRVSAASETVTRMGLEQAFTDADHSLSDVKSAVWSDLTDVKGAAYSFALGKLAHGAQKRIAQEKATSGVSALAERHTPDADSKPAAETGPAPGADTKPLVETGPAPSVEARPRAQSGPEASIGAQPQVESPAPTPNADTQVDAPSGAPATASADRVATVATTPAPASRRSEKQGHRLLDEKRRIEAADAVVGLDQEVKELSSYQVRTERESMAARRASPQSGERRRAPDALRNDPDYRKLPPLSTDELKIADRIEGLEKVRQKLADSQQLTPEIDAYIQWQKQRLGVEAEVRGNKDAISTAERRKQQIETVDRQAAEVELRRASQSIKALVTRRGPNFRKKSKISYDEVMGESAWRDLQVSRERVTRAQKSRRKGAKVNVLVPLDTDHLVSLDTIANRPELNEFLKTYSKAPRRVQDEMARRLSDLGDIDTNLVRMRWDFNQKVKGKRPWRDITYDEAKGYYHAADVDRMRRRELVEETKLLDEISSMTDEFRGVTQ